ncbi:MFS transporter [Moraxella sp. FZFQ2102]|uniref:MFS transporter n=1 Tax=Moraxella sp. FZFQ2102 TaxID=2953752 RepID=UPI00209C5EC4|nr:MFS transporter [Moraxella sp. FZFQ2102]USZ15121.1 MFS transporter [Moraxella sp. FZFQ2102]
MASQLSLFRRRAFNSMFFTQFFGAFNDNVFKQALILMLTYSAAAKLGMEVSLLNNLAALLFILPFFLFSALAGQISDKYEKSWLTRHIKLLEIIIMSMAAIGFIYEIYWLLFVCLFFMGAQSTFFGPIKYAYLPEAMPKNDLVGANGLFQTSTSLAILTGMMTAGVLTQLYFLEYWLSVLTIFIAILGYIAARQIPVTTIHAADLKIDWNIFRTSFDIIKYLYSLPLLFFIIMGNSWFWFYGATFLTQTPEVTKSILHGDESVVIFLLTLFSVGTAIGSLLCKTLTKNQVSFRLLPVGIAGLSIFAAALYFSLGNLSISADAPMTLDMLFKIDGVMPVFAELFLLGLSGGLYIVPLYTSMQAYAPIEHRSRVVGANNIFNAIYMVVSAVFAIVILTILGLSLGQLFLITGIVNLIFGVILYLKLQQYKNSLPISADDTPMLG